MKSSIMKSSRKSQMKMGETIAILFIFFLLLIVGAVFYMNVQSTTVYREISQAYELKAVEISQIISFLPELQCTESNVVQSSCFDLHKMLALEEITKTPEGLVFYNREFGQTRIEVLRIYPKDSPILIWNSENPDFEDAFVTHIPISIFNAATNKRSLGVLEITVYQ